MSTVLYCRNCPKIIVKGKLFCTQSCSAKYNNQLRAKRTDESKQRTSNTLRSKYQSGILTKPTPLINIKHGNCKKRTKSCQVCGVSFIGTAKSKTCGKECQKTILSKTSSDWLKKNRSHIRGSGNKSYMEKSFTLWLHQNQILRGFNGYLDEIHFYNKTTNKHGWIDFVFPRQKLIIELDGSHHKNRVNLDTIRDQHLEGRGWKVLRITHREYQKRTREPLVRQLLNLAALPGIEPGP